MYYYFEFSMFSKSFFHIAILVHSNFILNLVHIHLGIINKKGTDQQNMKSAFKIKRRKDLGFSQLAT